ncbi:hypothetical protein GlitD10_0489 [Gloeomargarita lithophora Alchichica-D10]|uniref:AlpA family phage regulatory protein n=2 Tax=Gloeomargarita TaxID=1188227 RepID=A0A1J0AA77_9CYAN|nr:hypothetical protein GlitD10_0489 [Gloeomargarita lithophora Alchichica-D10]
MVTYSEAGLEYHKLIRVLALSVLMLFGYCYRVIVSCSGFGYRVHLIRCTNVSNCLWGCIHAIVRLLLPTGGNFMSSVLRRCEVLKRLGISKSTLQRWVEAGHFPRPMQIGPRAVAWPESDLTVFLANRQRTGGVE